MCAEYEASVQFIQGIVQPALPYRNLCCLKIACISLSLGPCGLPEQFVGFIILTLILQRKGEIVDWLAVVGVRVAFLRQFHGLAQIVLSLAEAPPADIPQAKLVQAAYVVGVTAQGFLVIVNRTPRGMTVLLQVQAGEIELFVGLYLLRQQCGLSAVGDGTYLIALSMPLHHGAFLAVKRLAYHEVERAERGVPYVNSLRKHLLRAHRHHLIIILLTAIAPQYYVHFLP